MISTMIERCAGIDVGRKFVVVCVMVGDAHAEPSQQVRKFSTLNEGLEQLQECLRLHTEPGNSPTAGSDAAAETVDRLCHR
jgi:hypothetical protein